MNIKISIIIPVYNTKQFLEKCLNSAINQTLKEIEIIVINDASSDGSLDIIKDFQKRDDRIKLIDFKENKGNGFGRNEGVRNAVGDFILFLDSDDWLELNIAELTYTKAFRENLQVVLFGYTQEMTYIINPKKNKIIYLPSTDIDETNVFRYFMMHRKGLYSMPWVYLFSRDLLKKNSVVFSEGIYFEDIIFVANALYNTTSIGVINNIPLYNYRVRKNSITQTLSKKKIDDNFTAHVYLKEFLEEKGILKIYEKEYLIRFLVFCVFLSFYDYYMMSKKQKDKELDDYMFAIRNSKLLSFSNLMFIKKTANELDSDEVRIYESCNIAYKFLMLMKRYFSLFKFTMKSHKLIISLKYPDITN